MERHTTADQTILGPGARFKGDLSFDGVGKILGAFEGTIRGGEVQIGQGGSCIATIEADRIVIDGTHQGDLIARDCLQLLSKARVQGDIAAAALVVTEGATFVGRCIVGPEAVENASRTQAAEVRPSVPEPKAAAPKKVRTQPDWLESTPGAAPTADWLAGTATPVSVRPWVTAPVHAGHES